MRSLGVLFVGIALVGCSSEPVEVLDASTFDATVEPRLDATPGPDTDTPPPPDGGMPGAATLSDTSIDFGRVILGTTANRELRISNTSGEPATVTLSMPSGPDADRFTRMIDVADENGVFVVPVGAAVTVTIAVEPTIEGPLVASLAADLCGGRCPTAITLVAVASDSGVDCDTELDFGTVNPGSCAMAQVHCTNAGNLDEQITALNLAGDAEITSTTIVDPMGVVLTSGDAFDVDLSLCAADPGALASTLTVTSRNSTDTTHRISIRGRSGGGDIACAPMAIDFGLVAVNGNAQREVVCENRGPDALTIAAITASNPAFTTDVGSASIPAGDSLTITLTASGLALGALSGDLTITSDDPDAPTTTITLAANVVDLAPCAATLAPATVDFGVVSPGDRRTAIAVLTNTGMTDCVLDEIAVLGAADFSAALPITGQLPSGATLPIAVTFMAPAQAGTSSAAIEVSFVNPSSQPATGSLRGTSGATRLIIEPAAIDFGDAPAGCAAPFVRPVRLRSVSAQPINLTRVAIAGTSSAAFTLGALPMSRVLAPFASLTVDVSFAPGAPGVYAAQLEVELTGQTGATIAPLSGRGSAAATRSDLSTAGVPLLDLLIVTDDSTSMAAAQAALAATAPAIVDALSARNVDFHIGVVTTDMMNMARAGRMLGTPAVLDASSADLVDTLAARLAPGNMGDGSAEQAITAARAAVTAPLATTDNAGFLRPGADLAIVIVSDEDDQGTLATAAAIGDLRAAAGGGRVHVAVIVGPTSGQACAGPTGNGAAAPRYHELAARSDDGLELSICQPMAANIDAVLARLAGGTTVALTARPLVSTLAVSVGGVTVPATGWTYAAATNSIILDTAPAAGAIVRVDYQQFCLSPTCGDGMTDAFEQCDDDNDDDTDACTEGCVLARCGDGFTRAGTEACDDGNLVDTDACTTACAAARCGDGFVQAGVEDCDDGNTMDGDACPANCDQRLDFDEWYAVAGPTTANFVPLGMGTPLTFMDLDDGFADLTLPFPFTLFGTVTTSIAVSPNGLVAARGLSGVGGAFTNASFPDAAAPDGVLAVWWEDLLIDTAVTGGAGVSYQVTGTAPNRTLVIEWRNLRLANHSTNNHRRFTMQLALREGTNVIEYRYGETATSGNPATATSASVGIEDLAGGIGADLLSCTPGCAGPARPQNPNGFPRQTVITITPL